MSVPGVTRRITSRRTTDLPPRFSRFRRVLDLLADGDADALRDQLLQVLVGGVDRHAAHRDVGALMLAALGQRDAERARGDLGVVEEHLVEIAHPVEQQAIRIGGLDLEILRHHRRRRRRRPRRRPSSSGAGAAVSMRPDASRSSARFDKRLGFPRPFSPCHSIAGDVSGDMVRDLRRASRREPLPRKPNPWLRRKRRRKPALRLPTRRR